MLLLCCYGIVMCIALCGSMCGQKEAAGDASSLLVHSQGVLGPC